MLIVVDGSALHGAGLVVDFEVSGVHQDPEIDLLILGERAAEATSSQSVVKWPSVRSVTAGNVPDGAFV